MHRFRFTAQVPDLGRSTAVWREELRRIEEMGFDTVALADHFTGGYEVEPFVALTAAAMATGLTATMLTFAQKSFCSLFTAVCPSLAGSPS